MSQANTTPTSQTEYDEELSPKSKLRVDSVDVNECRCLIENCPKECAVQYCHLFPRRLSKHDDLMTSLEWFWKMKHRSLNLDTRRNIFLVGASLRFLHDQNRWGLLPPEDIVNRYANSLVRGLASRKNFPNIPDDVYTYRFIPLHKTMELIGIVRQLQHSPTATSFNIFVYPFEGLHSLRCHVHPKFAIIELGRKLTLLDDDDRIRLLDQWPILETISTLYLTWTVLPPPNASDLNSFKSDSEPDDDPDDPDYRDDCRTSRTRRRLKPTKRKNPPSRDRDSPTRVSRARKNAADLSRETLVDHDNIVGKGEWTQESLSSWAQSAALVVRKP